MRRINMEKNRHNFFEYLCFFIVSFLVICPSIGVMITGRSFYPFFNYDVFAVDLNSDMSYFSIRGVFPNGSYYEFSSEHIRPMILNGLIEKMESLLEHPDGFIRIRKALHFFAKNYEEIEGKSDFIRIELVYKVANYDRAKARPNFWDSLTVIQEKVITYVNL